VTKLQYRYTGSHAQDFDVGDKVLMVGPGEAVELDVEGDDKQYAYLVEGGQLLSMTEVKSAPVGQPSTGGDK